MSFGLPYRYINGSELSELMKSDAKALRDYVVVDVRDDDFLGGNIVNCLRSPSEKFEDNLDELVEKTKDVPKIIFHCALSQARGPKAARIYAEARKEKSKENEVLKQEVLVLRGGFTDFQAVYRHDPVLVEKWRTEVWGRGWY